MIDRLIAPPAGLAVSMVAARASARTSGAALDAELEQKVRDFTEDAEHRTGRALITQTWEVTLDAFPDAIRLPHAPLASVAYVKFYDVDGVLQTLDPQDYLVDAKSEPGYVVPAPGRAWPATAARINSVEVQYVCGYGPDETSVPAAIKGYILGMIENDYFPNPNVQYLSRKLDRYWVPG
jgi:uncharacterized phiE125 gp8 family phage protein